VTDTLSGLWARALANRFTREYTESGAPVLPPLVQRGAANDVFIAALKQGDAAYYPMMAGQSVGSFATCRARARSSRRSSARPAPC
jgi:NAD(P)H-dependent flavin oxidoreductase YrpB (nitropropane dioxygenase family)